MDGPASGPFCAGAIGGGSARFGRRRVRAGRTTSSWVMSPVPLWRWCGSFAKDQLQLHRVAPRHGLAAAIAQDAAGGRRRGIRIPPSCPSTPASTRCGWAARRFGGSPTAIGGAEGPVWFGDGRYLLWSDIPNDRIMRWDEATGQVATFRTPSNFANGRTRDRQGRLIACAHGGRRVTRTEYDGGVTVLVDSF